MWLPASTVSIGLTMDMFGMGHHGSITVGGKEQAPYGELQILTKQVFAVFVCLTWMKSQSTEGAFGCDTTLPYIFSCIVQGVTSSTILSAPVRVLLVLAAKILPLQNRSI